MSNSKPNTLTVSDPTLIVQALTGLKDVNVLGFERCGPRTSLLIERILGPQVCPRCGQPAAVKDRPWVCYVDLPCYGKQMKLRWRKHRLTCPYRDCEMRSWIVQDPRIASKRSLMTTRAAKWATRQVGEGRTVSEVARELGCDWKVVNNTVQIYGQALLEADKKRLRDTDAIGLDEIRFLSANRQHRTRWATTVVDVTNHQLIDIVNTRDYVQIAGWVDRQPQHFKANLKYGTLDMSNIYSAVFSRMLPHITQIIDPFHCLRLGTNTLDQTRRRNQNEQHGHRGRKNEPLYQARKILLMAGDKLDQKLTDRLNLLLELGDPHGEIALSYAIKEALRTFYKQDNENSARTLLENIIQKCGRKTMPTEIQTLARTLQKWFHKILNWHTAKKSNGPTEALNHLIKRIKRIAFGFTNFQNFRTLALLYAGKPNWKTLNSITIN